MFHQEAIGVYPTCMGMSGVPAKFLGNFTRVPHVLGLRENEKYPTNLGWCVPAEHSGNESIRRYLIRYQRKMA